jgi:hypothetical protein
VAVYRFWVAGFMRTGAPEGLVTDSFRQYQKAEKGAGRSPARHVLLLP